MQNSDYIIYVDESGDHGLKNIDSDYPIFVLSFCCFCIEDYINTAVPQIQQFKFNYFGHDQAILHERKIRKQGGEFSFLRKDRELRKKFLADVASLVSETPFQIFPVIIDKSELSDQYREPFNPYHLGIRFGLERLLKFLLKNDQEGRTVHIIFEKRGKKEDNELELEFLRICEGNQQFGYKTLDFSLIDFKSNFVDKRSNSCGLQLADLTARPIGLNYLRPNQKNRAYETISEKINRVKVFP